MYAYISAGPMGTGDGSPNFKAVAVVWVALLVIVAIADWRRLYAVPAVLMVGSTFPLGFATFLIVRNWRIDRLTAGLIVAGLLVVPLTYHVLASIVCRSMKQPDDKKIEG